MMNRGNNPESIEVQIVVQYITECITIMMKKQENFLISMQPMGIKELLVLNLGQV